MLLIFWWYTSNPHLYSKQHFIWRSSSYFVRCYSICHHSSHYFCFVICFGHFCNCCCFLYLLFPLLFWNFYYSTSMTDCLASTLDILNWPFYSSHNPNIFDQVLYSIQVDFLSHNYHTLIFGHPVFSLCFWVWFFWSSHHPQALSWCLYSHWIHLLLSLMLVVCLLLPGIFANFILL